jgi:hypothetical protein
VLAAESAALSDLAAKRAVGPGGMYAPMAGRHGDEEHDRTHNSRLPNVDTGIFAVDQRTSTPVIGDVTDREHHLGL